MKFVDLITPKRKEDGSLDYRYIAISEKLCNLVGERHMSNYLSCMRNQTYSNAMHQVQDYGS